MNSALSISNFSPSAYVGATQRQVLGATPALAADTRASGAPVATRQPGCFCARFILLRHGASLCTRSLPRAPIALFLPGADPVEPDLIYMTSSQNKQIGTKGVFDTTTLVIVIISLSMARVERTV